MQNADDAKATRFSIIVDERPKSKHDTLRKSLLSEEIDDWQGPAIWIYNDALFTIKDFQALKKLGTGSKSRDDTKIGRFGIGFNCAFHITDLPSIVSGEHIAFLDPNAQYLPPQGYPSERHRGTKINFIETKFKERFPDQCYPYEAIEGCDLSKEFNGTLFRLPLRTLKSAEKSEISNKVVGIREILQRLRNIKGNREMLFLRNIESCSLYQIRKQDPPQLKWQAQISMSESCRNKRKSITDKMQTYQLDIERDYVKNKKVETWLLCTGGHDRVKKVFKELSYEKQTDLEKFSNEKRLKVI